MKKIERLKIELNSLLEDGIPINNYDKVLKISQQIDKYVTKELKKSIRVSKL